MIGHKPKYETQYDSEGNPEKVDISIYCYRVICVEPGCFKIRYIRPQDRIQVRMCKYHAALHRKKLRALSAKLRRKRRTVMLKNFKQEFTKKPAL